MSQTDVSSLVRNTFYVSPEFESEIPDGTTIQRLDPRDDIEEWMESNLLDGRQFVGEDGVNAIILQYPKWPASAPRHSAGLTGPYHRIIKIDSMPASRQVPEEIVAELTNRGYTQEGPDHPDVKYGLYSKIFQ